MDVAIDSVSRECKRRKLYNNNTNLKRETAKVKRAEGEAYVSSSGRVIGGKEFISVTECCNEMCFRNIVSGKQEELFDGFYSGQIKGMQDSYISKCMSTENLKSMKLDSKKSRINIWSYKLHYEGVEIKTCQMFLRKLFQISEKRIRVIQSKILNNEDFRERRGSHSNRPHKLKPNVMELMKRHLDSIPHDESHYCAHKTSLKYFENPDLTIKHIYFLFKEFHKSHTNEELKMGYPHYFKKFKSFDYSIKSPKTDVCDFCTSHKEKLARDPLDTCRVAYEIHVRKYKRRQQLKEEYLSKAKTDPSYLVLEFDYAQNYPVPRLNVNSQFYKRLLWLYAFNIHVFNDNESIFYCFMETQSAKNSNSVASFLYDCLLKNMKKFPQVKNIVLLSDSAGGQNRNLTMTKFFNWFSKVYNVEMIQLFPVRGHSFTQCDRNFGLVRKYVKKKEIMGTAKPWMEAIVEARKIPSPFQLIMDRELIHDWEKALKPFFINIKKSVKKQQFTIMKYVMLKYKTNGSVLASNNFIPIFKPFKLLTTTDKDVLNGVNLETVPYPEVSEAKINDVKSLLKYLPKDDEEWIERLIDEKNL